MCGFGEVDSGRDVLKDGGRVFFSLKRAFTPPDPASLTQEHLFPAEKAALEVLNSVHPTLDAEERRRDVIDYLQRLVITHVNCEVFPYGSVPLKTYLPDGDIDLTVLKGPNAEESLAHDVYALLCMEEKNKYAEFQISDTQFIDAEVKLVKCIVQDIVVDISFNQLGGLSTLCFLEQVDRLVSKNNLFKRSIILIKAWCFYESRILGATHGLMSTYALETLILFIFQVFHSSLTGPLMALYKFLDYFSQFDWDNHCVSLKGPICKSSLPDIVVINPNNEPCDLLLGEQFMENNVEMLSVPFGCLEATQKVFQPKHLNIIDPLKENNNLGRSVHKGNFFRIRSAFKFGARRLGQVLLLPEDQVTHDINKFFANTLSRHKKQTAIGIEHLALEIGDVSSTGSLSSHIEFFSEDDLRLKSSVRDYDDESVVMEENSIFLFENEPDRYSVGGGYSDMASESCYSSEGVAVSCHSITVDAQFDLVTTNSSLKVVPDSLSNSENCSSLSDNLGDKSNYMSVESTAKNKSLGSYSLLEHKELDETKKRCHCCMNSLECVSLSDSGLFTPRASILEYFGDDSRETDLSSIDSELAAINHLANLSGDYDSHIRSFLYGQISHGFASSSFLLSSAPSPSRIQGQKQYDSGHQSIPLSSNYMLCMNSCNLSMRQTVNAFLSEGRSNVQGTGTYFPSTNAFYRERSEGRERGKPGNHYQFHRYRSCNRSYTALSRSNSLGSGANEVLTQDSNSQDQQKSVIQRQSASPAGDGNQTTSFLNSSCRIEFGTVGNLAEQVMSSSSRFSGNTKCGLTGNAGFNFNCKAKEVSKAVINTP